MVLLESFSVTYQLFSPTPLTEKSKIFDAFSMTIAPSSLETHLTEKSLIFNAFSVTTANNADVEAYRDPFGLITHKKKY